MNYSLRIKKINGKKLESEKLDCQAINEYCAEITEPRTLNQR